MDQHTIDQPNDNPHDANRPGQSISRAAALDFRHSDKHTAARVLAKGAGPMAQQMAALAQQHNILVLQDFVLSERLAAVPVGSSMPDTVFTALSVMLDFVQQEDGRKPDKA